MKYKILYMPCFVYSIAFSFILILYQIGWSDLYPELHGFLLFFLLGTCVISFILALIQSKTLELPISDIKLSEKFIKRSLIFIITGNFLEFAYERTIPIISTLINPNFDYHDYNGIPTFHVILSTFNIFFCILLFDYFLSTKNRKHLYNFILTLFFFVLIMNRGAFMIVFTAIIFIYLAKTKSINIKNILKSAAILGIVLYFFGVIGNIRQTQTKTEKTYVLRIAGATDKFLESGVPQEFYWSYIYLISPIGNLQNIVDHKADVFDTKNIGFFTATELLPDFISKRVSSIFDYDEIINKDLGSRYLVTINLNAPTVYYNSYLNLGSAGMYIMYFIMMMAAVFYPKILNRINNPYYLSAVAALNSILFLSMFNNMWFNIGTVLLWPIILDVFRRLRFS